jgi:molybdopterin converting factor small subunit
VQIKLKAFSTLRPHLESHHIGYLGELYQCPENLDIQGLIFHLGFNANEVEGAFVNHTVVPKTTKLKDGDMVALIPPGTPGSYRLILGIKENA